MIRNNLHYENRIALLRARGETQNDKLIKKARRRQRALNNKNS